MLTMCQTYSVSFICINFFIIVLLAKYSCYLILQMRKDTVRFSNLLKITQIASGGTQNSNLDSLTQRPLFQPCCIAYICKIVPQLV